MMITCRELINQAAMCFNETVRQLYSVPISLDAMINSLFCRPDQSYFSLFMKKRELRIAFKNIYLKNNKRYANEKILDMRRFIGQKLQEI